MFGQSMKTPVRGTVTGRKPGCERVSPGEGSTQAPEQPLGQVCLILVKESLHCWGHWVSGVDLEDTYTIGCDFLQAAFSSLLAVSCLTSVWSLDSAANLQTLKHPFWIQMWSGKIKEGTILQYNGSLNETSWFFFKVFKKKNYSWLQYH